MLKGSRTPTRAEYKRLKADYERLRSEFDALRQRVYEQAQELKVQFTRIAEMQAILDEERLHDARAHAEPPLQPPSQSAAVLHRR
jgi:hypothetical protein